MAIARVLSLPDSGRGWSAGLAASRRLPIVWFAVGIVFVVVVVVAAAPAEAAAAAEVVVVEGDMAMEGPRRSAMSLVLLFGASDRA